MVKFQNRPSTQAVERYCQKIEEFLAAHNLKIRVELRDSPMLHTCYYKGNVEEKENLWIGALYITTPDVQNLPVHVISDGIDEQITDGQIWRDAWRIQNDLYLHLKKFPSIENRSEPYWELWNHLPKQ